DGITLRPGDRQPIGGIAIHQPAFSITVAVEIQRTLVIGDRHDDMLLPRVLGSVARILEPPGLLPGKIDDDEVLPAVVVQILSPVHERVAVCLDVEAVSLFAEDVHRPFALTRPSATLSRRERGWLLVPNGAGGNVEPAVVVEIAHTDAFAA